jgi:3-keto-5-aminohexanoate cleavage enzyme
VRGGAPATPQSLVSMVERLPDGATWQVIGIGRGNLAMTTMGLAMGGNARTGMEDTLMLRRGVPASGNGALVERLAAVARAIEREPATVAQAAASLGLA